MTSAILEHPYAGAKDAIHRTPLEPADKTFNHRETLYHTQPPIYDKEQVKCAYQKLLDTPVTVTAQEKWNFATYTQLKKIENHPKNIASFPQFPPVSPTI